MTQDPMNFWEFQVAVQSMNALYVQVTNAKVNLVKDFCKWLAEVKGLDDEKRFECDQMIKAFEQSAASRATSRDATAHNTLSGPSRKANTVPTASTASINAMTKIDYPPKLTEDETPIAQICLKCRKPFIYHKGSDKALGCSHADSGHSRHASGL
jgi:hypothetical protein